MDATTAITFSINVNSVNDVPTFTAGADQTVLEDAGAQTVLAWATAMSAGPANEAAQTLTFQVTNNNNSLFSVQPSIDPVTGNLTYTPAANGFGTATVSVILKDNGGTANGGVDATTAITFSITVTSVNDAPTFIAGADQTVAEDAGAKTVLAWATAINAGPANEAAQTLTFQVTNNNNSLFSAQPAIDATTGNLTYTLAANTSGTATVSVVLKDNGGTANGGVDATTAITFSINVNSVNDVPTFTAGADQTVLEDAGAQTVLAWATAMSAGPVNEAAQTLTFQVTNNNNSLFSSQPVIDPVTGNLTYTPAVNGFGTATVSVILKDNGGTANGGVDATTAITFSITVTSVNDAPSFIAGADQTVAEDAGAKTVLAWATAISAGPANESAQTLTFQVTNNNNSLFSAQPAIDATTGNLTYTPAANTSGTATVSVVLKDNGGTANGGVDATTAITFSINVNSVNDVPTFTAGTDQTVLEDAGAQTVLAWATAMSAGPANEAAQTLTFQVTNNNNSLFSSQPVIDPVTGNLTYTPAANTSGTATVSVILKDDGGTANGGVDATTAITFSITITAVNKAPSFIKGTDQSVLEDAGSQTVSAWATAISAGPASESVQTLSFQVTNNNNSLFSTQPAINAATGNLTYTPAANAFGTATVSVILKDNGGTANGGVDATTAITFTIKVTSVNDVPKFTVGGAQTVREDAGNQTVSAWATAISAGPANESAQTLTFQVTNNNNSLFSTQPAINASGNLSYTPAANAFGTATVSVILKDNGGTANGGVDATTAITFTINVTSVNDVPKFTAGGSQTVREDAGAQTVSAWATAISAGPANESAQTLAFQVTNSNNSLFTVQPAINASGNLTYTPAANAFGTATVSVILKDNGGTANGGVDATTAITFTINVTSINDVPTFTAGANQTVSEDAGAQTVSAWATAISAGPANESAQILTFQVTNNNNSLFSTQPAINPANGNLTYTPAANNYGTATVSVILKDNGGTANGGVDATSAITFTINVNAVNDAPSFTAGANQTVLEDGGAQTVIAWATAMSAGPANESAQTLAFQVTNNNNSLFSTQPAINASGNLTYTPAANAFGTATVSVILKDDGGTANGGVDTSTAITFTISLTSINNAPSFNAGANQTVPEDAGAQTIASWATAITAGPVNESSQTLTFQVTNNNNSLFAIQPAINTTTGNLTYTPAANAFGMATVSVILRDNGGTANGGVDATTVITFTISVISVNDAPSFTAGVDQSVLEDAGIQTVSAWATAISAGPANESAQTLAFQVTNNNNSLFSTQPAINASGNLTYTPAANAFGTATVSVILKDDGGTTNGGIDATTAITFTIKVLPVNDAPTSTDFSIQTNMNQSYIFSSGLFPFMNPEEPTDKLSSVIFETPVTGGSVQYFGKTITGKVTIPADSLTQVSFVPKTGLSGDNSGKISFRVRDNNSTAASNGIAGSEMFHILINIVHVNQAPEVQNPVADIQLDEFTEFDFAAASNLFSDPDGDNLSIETRIISGNWLEKISGNHISGFPLPDSDNQAVVTIRATDPLGKWVETSFRINIIKKKRPLIYGQITSRSTLPRLLKVILLDLNSKKLDTLAITSTVGRDYYFFEGIPSGKYLIKAVNKSATESPLIVSTYYDATTDWVKAKTISVNSTSEIKADIGMLVNPVTSGSGAISGILRGTTALAPGQLKVILLGNMAGDPFPFADIFLTIKGASSPFLSTQTGSDGSYQFKNIPDGEYTVSAYIPGFTLINQYAITIGKSVNYENLNFIAYLGDGVTTDVPNYNVLDMSIYPNPTTGIINLLSNITAKTLSVKVISMSGQIMMNKEYPSASLLQFDIGNLSPSTYLIVVKAGNNYKTFHVILIK